MTESAFVLCGAVPRIYELGLQFEVTKPAAFRFKRPLQAGNCIFVWRLRGKTPQ